MTKFSDSDIIQIKNHGLTLETVNEQIRNFETGFAPANITQPATLGNGVISPENESAAEYFRSVRNKYNIVKFVPASGAATRMFKDLYNYMDSGEMNKTAQQTLDNLDKFAFYGDLQKYLPANATNLQKIQYIITDAGLNYGALPKALLKFHKYDDGARTALEEHLVEGAQYAATNGRVRIHFTVSPEHQNGFSALLKQVLPKYEQKFGVKYDISMSNQMPQTDTIAVCPDNTPFRTNDGKLLFRPAGHGALIENLNNIDADIIFIKNIDNVCPDSARHTTIKYKELLAGVAIQTQQKIFEFMRALDSGTADVQKIAEFINNNLGVRVDAKTATADMVKKILNRPLRACGIVRNSGAPGGGPFWVRGDDGRETLQIMEPGQIAPDKMDILTQGEFFNPVDLVCAVRDWNGRRFDLTKYIDPKTGFISEKSSGGRPLRAMERPGLWNGAMANWNTIFVTVPAETFTPAKVVTDLLTRAHQNTK